MPMDGQMRNITIVIRFDEFARYVILLFLSHICTTSVFKITWQKYALS